MMRFCKETLQSFYLTFRFNNSLLPCNTFRILNYAFSLLLKYLNYELWLFLKKKIKSVNMCMYIYIMYINIMIGLWIGSLSSRTLFLHSFHDVFIRYSAVLYVFFVSSDSLGCTFISQ